MTFSSRQPPGGLRRFRYLFFSSSKLKPLQKISVAEPESSGDEQEPAKKKTSSATPQNIF